MVEFTGCLYLPRMIRHGDGAWTGSVSVHYRIDHRRNTEFPGHRVLRSAAYHDGTVPVSLIPADLPGSCRSVHPAGTAPVRMQHLNFSLRILLPLLMQERGLVRLPHRSRFFYTLFLSLLVVAGRRITIDPPSAGPASNVIPW